MKKLLATLSLAACAAFTASAATINLANVTADRTLNNGDVATGALGGNYKISIAADATITLNQAQIYGRGSGSYPWAGLTCLGDATIILKSNDNEILGFSSNYPGIYVPVGCTLTIKGDGTLYSMNNGKGAAIGSGDAHAVDCKACGNIVIEGGVIKATTGYGGAGIGSGAGAGDGSAGPSCGNIVIMGGDITVQKTGSDGAGIGSGGRGASCGSIAIMGGSVRALNCCIGSGDWSSSCGDILISEGVSYVNAITSTGSAIGAGSQGSTCGTVTISKGLTQNGGADTHACEIRHLSDLQRDIKLANGSVLTGTLAANVKVSIADGATVTLRDVTINGMGSGAGITCDGDATIILEGASTVRASVTIAGFPGIYVPEGKTLTIRGGGSLTASGNMYGAGIGGGGLTGGGCGNIVIESGTVIAAGGALAAGIGGGYNNACGDITIMRGVTSVTATKGTSATDSIGASSGGSCGTVTVGGVVGEISQSSYTYYGNGTGGVTELPAPAFAADGKAATTEFVKGANGKWTLTTFAEMSNDALGSGVADGQIKVYAAPTVEGLNNASPMTSGVTVKGKKSAVMTTIEVTPPGNPSTQFFKVKFGE